MDTNLAHKNAPSAATFLGLLTSHQMGWQWPSLKAKLRRGFLSSAPPLNVTSPEMDQREAFIAPRRWEFDLMTQRGVINIIVGFFGFFFFIPLKKLPLGSQMLWPQKVGADFCGQGELLLPLLNPGTWAMWRADTHDLNRLGFCRRWGTTAVFIVLMTSNKGQAIWWKQREPQALNSFNVLLLTLFDDRYSINTITNCEIQPPMLPLTDSLFIAEEYFKWNFDDWEPCRTHDWNVTYCIFWMVPWLY